MDSRSIGCMCNLSKKKKIRNEYIDILVIFTYKKKKKIFWLCLIVATLQRGRVYFTMRVCHL